MGSSKRMDKEIYDAIPVFYCKQCLSLRIKGLPGKDGIDFCDDCNSTDINTADIFTWEELYKQRYGNYLINLERNGREEDKIQERNY